MESPSPGFSQRNDALNSLGLVDRLPRVIYFNQTDEEIVLLVAVYAKAERENLLPKDIRKVV